MASTRTNCVFTDDFPQCRLQSIEGFSWNIYEVRVINTWRNITFVKNLNNEAYSLAEADISVNVVDEVVDFQ